MLRLPQSNVECEKIKVEDDELVLKLDPVQLISTLRPIIENEGGGGSIGTPFLAMYSLDRFIEPQQQISNESPPVCAYSCIQSITNDFLYRLHAMEKFLKFLH